VPASSPLALVSHLTRLTAPETADPGLHFGDQIENRGKNQKESKSFFKDEANHFSVSKLVKGDSVAEKEKVKTGNEVQTGKEGTKKIEKGTQRETGVVNKLKQTSGIQISTAPEIVEALLQPTTAQPQSKVKGKEPVGVDLALLSTLKPSTTTAELTEARGTTLRLDFNGETTTNTAPVTKFRGDTASPVTEGIPATTLIAIEDNSKILSNELEEFIREITTRPNFEIVQIDTTATVLSEILADTTAKPEEVVNDQVTLSPTQKTIPIKGKKLILAQPETQLPNIDILLPPFNSQEVNNNLADDDYLENNSKGSDNDNEDDEDYDEWILSLRTTPELSNLKASSGDPVKGVESLLLASGEVATSQEDSRRDGTEEIPLSIPRENWVNNTETLFIPNIITRNSSAFNGSIKEGSFDNEHFNSNFENPINKENASGLPTEVLLPQFQGSPRDQLSDGMWIPVSILHEEIETATDITRKQERTAETVGNFQPSTGTHKVNQPGVFKDSTPRNGAHFVKSPGATVILQTTVKPKQPTSVTNFKTGSAIQKVPEPVGRRGRILGDSKANDGTHKTSFNVRLKEEEPSALRSSLLPDKGSTFNSEIAAQTQNFTSSSRDLRLDTITDFHENPAVSTTKPALGDRLNVTLSSEKKIQQTNSPSKATTAKVENNVSTVNNFVQQNSRLATTTLKPSNNIVPVTTANSPTKKQQKPSQPSQTSKHQGKPLPPSKSPSVPAISKIHNEQNLFSTDRLKLNSSQQTIETPLQTNVKAPEFTTILPAATKKTVSSLTTKSSQSKKNLEITTVSSRLGKETIGDKNPDASDHVSTTKGKTQVDHQEIGHRQGRLLSIPEETTQNKQRPGSSHRQSNPQQKNRTPGQQPAVALKENNQSNHEQHRLQSKVNGSGPVNQQSRESKQRNHESKRPTTSQSISQLSQTQQGTKVQNNRGLQEHRQGSVITEKKNPTAANAGPPGPTPGSQKPQPDKQVPHSSSPGSPGLGLASDLQGGKSEETSKGAKNSWPVLIKNGKELPFYTLTDPGDRPPSRTRPPPLGLVALSGLWEQGLDNHVDSDPL
jgi:hypothetical protein